MPENSSPQHTEDFIRAASSSDVKVLASAIIARTHTLNGKGPIVRCIGPSAVNQAIKAIIVSNKQFVSSGKIATILPLFKDIIEGDLTVTAVELHLKFQDIT